jgi:hypothetical protein
MRKLSLALALFLAAICFPVAAQDDRPGSIAAVWGSNLSSERVITLGNEKREVLKRSIGQRRKFRSLQI